MNPPKIFISATSGDLSSARQIAKEALLTINCHPVEQTNFEPDWRSVTDMLRGKIGDCQALIHLVGFRYGAEPDPATLPGGTPRRSYTQMEYHLARELGLRVYTFLLPETYPFDVPAKADTPEQTQFQDEHRAFIQSNPQLYEKPANEHELRARIIALREQVISLEQERQSIAQEVKTTRHWGLWTAVAILLILGVIGVWPWRGQSQLSSQVQAVSQKQDEQTNLLKDQSNLLRKAVVQLEQLTEEKSRLGIKITDLPREAVENELAARVGVSAVELRLNIEAGKNSQDALTRAHAHLLAGKLADAHAAAKEVRDAEAPALHRIIQSHRVDGQAYVLEAKFEAALESYQKAVVLVDKAADPIAWAAAQGWVAFILEDLARYQEAEPLLREVLRLRELHLGPNDPQTATALSDLATLLMATNRHTDAEPLIRRALKIDEASYGLNHPTVAIRLNNLAMLLHATNRDTEAEPLMQRALKIDEASYDSDHPDMAIRLNNMAQLLKATNRLMEAEPLMRRALKIDEASYGSDHPNVARHLNNMARLLQDTNRLMEAVPLIQRALRIYEASYGPNHPSVAAALNNLAGLFYDTNRLTEAVPLMQRALKIDEASYGPDHPDVASKLHNLAGMLTVMDRQAEAEPLMRRAIGIYLQFQMRTGHRHPEIVAVVENYLTLAYILKVPSPDCLARLDQLRQETGLEAAALEAILLKVVESKAVGPFQVTITEVIKGGQAEALGLQVGDCYVSYNGQAITSTLQLIGLTGESKGEAILLEVLRDGQKMTFTAKPGKLGTHIENRPLAPATGAGTAK